MNRECTRDRVSLVWIAIPLLLSVSCALIDHKKPKRHTVKALPASVFTEKSTTRGSGDSTPQSSVSTSVIGLINSRLKKSGIGQEDNLIIITMNSENYHQLMHGMLQRSDLSDESELPERYQAFLNRLKARYGITIVANWSLDSIGLQCFIFETDGTRERQRIVTKLTQESNVDSAEVVQAFTIQQRR